MKRQGLYVCGLGIKDHAYPELADLCDDYREVGIAKLGAAIRYFRRRGVTRATMAGKIHKVKLFLPDWTCIRTFYPHFVTRTKDRKDDTLLLGVIEAYARCGIEFAPATDFVPELLVKSGTLSRRGLSRAERLDIQFGWEIAKQLGQVDVGQTVAVKGRAVLAVEAIEGTDACIRRAGELCAAGGFTVVKTAKPQQDMRFDVPTIGVGTLQSLLESRGRVLAVEAGKTIIVDEPEVIQFADRHRLTLVAIDAAQIQQLSDAA